MRSLGLYILLLTCRLATADDYQEWLNLGPASSCPFNEYGAFVGTTQVTETVYFDSSETATLTTTLIKISTKATIITRTVFSHHTVTESIVPSKVESYPVTVTVINSEYLGLSNQSNFLNDTQRPEQSTKSHSEILTLLQQYPTLSFLLIVVLVLLLLTCSILLCIARCSICKKNYGNLRKLSQRVQKRGTKSPTIITENPRSVFPRDNPVSRQFPPKFPEDMAFLPPTKSVLARPPLPNTNLAMKEKTNKKNDKPSTSRTVFRHKAIMEVQPSPYQGNHVYEDPNCEITSAPPCPPDREMNVLSNGNYQNQGPPKEIE